MMNDLLTNAAGGEAAGFLVFLAIVFFAGVFMLLIPYLREKSRSGMKQRLETLSVEFGTNAVAEQYAEELFNARFEDDQVLSRYGRFRQKLDNWLDAVGGQRALPVMLGCATGLWIVVFMVGQSYFLLPTWIAAVSGLVAAIVGPIWYVRRQDALKKQAFLDNFPDAIDMVTRAIKAGIPITDAMASAGAEVASPVREEFQQISEEIGIGVSMDVALANAALRIGVPDFQFFVVTLVLQRETGGHLAETLENLSNLIRRRKEMRKRISAITAEGRLSAKMVGSMPFVVCLMLYMLNRDYIMPLFVDEEGKFYLLAALGMVSIGMLIVNRLVKVKV
jgi:Flp pilus assembly protein TadB